MEQPNFKKQKYNEGMFYPKDELTYICTVDGPLNKQHERRDGDDDQFCSWDDINNRIGWWFASWKDVTYDVIGDGTFEHPTREQQLQIQSKIGIK